MSKRELSTATGDTTSVVAGAASCLGRTRVSTGSFPSRRGAGRSELIRHGHSPLQPPSKQPSLRSGTRESARAVPRLCRDSQSQAPRQHDPVLATRPCDEPQHPDSLAADPAALAHPKHVRPAKAVSGASNTADVAKTISVRKASDRRMVCIIRDTERAGREFAAKRSLPGAIPRPISTVGLPARRSNGIWRPYRLRGYASVQAHAKALSAMSLRHQAPSQRMHFTAE